MDFFFYAVLFLLFLLLPLSVQSEGSFWLEKRICLLSIKIFSIRILRIRLLFSEEGITISLNGKKGKTIGKSDKNEKKNKRSSSALLKAIYLRNLTLSIYAGGDAANLSLFLAMLKKSILSGIKFLKSQKRADRCKITVLPCYVNDHTTVNFSISLFTCGALLMAALPHTNKGAKNAKRSDREFDG